MTIKQYLSQRLSGYGIKDLIMSIPTLTERQRTILIMRDFDLVEMEDISDKIGLSQARVIQIYTKARYRVKNYIGRISGIEAGFEDRIKRENLLRYEIEKLKERILEQNKQIPTIEEIDATIIEDIGLSARLYNSLKANKINTVGDVRSLAFHEPFKFRGFGKKSFNELSKAMDSIGVKWPIKQSNKTLYK